MENFGQLSQQWRQFWLGMSPARRLGTGAVLALAMTVILGVGYWASQPEYRVLATGMGAEDAGAVAAKLKAHNVAYQLDAGGANILVPADQLASSRLLLANEDLPGKGGKGFELFDQSSIGATPFNQHVNYLRALQVELARTIIQIDPIVFARVHLVRPDPSPFLREQKPTSASVVLRLKPAATLNRSVASGIVALVSRSVEGLSRDNVTIVDTNGHQYTEEKSADVGSESVQLDRRRDKEKELSERAESMLAKAVGPGRAIVRVTADVHYHRLHEKKEIVSQETSAKKSESTTSKKTAADGGPGGPAGTASNLGKGGAVKLPGGSNTEETVKIEYVVPTSTSETENSKEEIQRLTIAALIDLAGEDKDGKKTILTLAEAEQLIKQAVGFKTGRDEIKVTEVRLSPPGSEPLPEYDWEAMQRWQLIATVIRHSSLGIAALAGLGLGWMALRRIRLAAAPAATTAAAPDAIPVRDRLTKTAQQDPEALARILAQWLEQADRPRRAAA